MYPLTPRDNCISEYLLYYMLSPVFVSYAQLISDRVAMPKINREQLSIVRVPNPPLSEQQTIVKYLDAETAKIDVLITETQKAVDLLCERRTALISAAVIGKINVRVDDRKSNTTPVVIVPPFGRFVFAAEIIDQMSDLPEFGHVFFQKCLYVAQYHLRIGGFDESYSREIAGPYDTRLIHAVDSRLEKSRWFKLIKTSDPFSYVRLEKCGKHKSYFHGYFGPVADEFYRLLALFRHMKKRYRAEIIATLYAVWNDFLIQDELITDDRIIDEVLTNWHESKTRYSREKWLTALNWMRDNGLTPTGFGKATLIRNERGMP